MSAAETIRRPLSLAYTSPEAGAGAETFALQTAWGAALQTFLAPTTRQPRPWTSTTHPLTKTAAEYVRSLTAERRAIAENALDQLCAALRDVSTAGLPALSAVKADDGALILEWTFGDRRLGFTIEVQAEESGWYFVFSSGSSERYEAGTMDQLEMSRLVTAMLTKSIP